eukprot:scaffold2815_cov113-Isochrysis_galbana.AAC.12
MGGTGCESDDLSVTVNEKLLQHVGVVVQTKKGKGAKGKGSSAVCVCVGVSASGVWRALRGRSQQVLMASCRLADCKGSPSGDRLSDGAAGGAAVARGSPSCQLSSY